MESIINKAKSAANKLNIELTVLKTKQEKRSYWKNKVWNAIGDSITAQNLYPRIVAKSLGLVINNYGVSSSTVAINNNHLQNQSIYERVIGINGNPPITRADIWTVFGGINDWYFNTPLGDINSNDALTFYGALKATVENIKNRENAPALLLFTPLQSKFNMDTNEIGLKVGNYRQAIIEIGNLYKIPILDLYKVGGFNKDNLEKITMDGLHPNILGVCTFAPKIIETIQEVS